MEEKHGAGEASDEAGCEERDHDAAWNVEPLSIGAAAGGLSAPEGDRVGGVRGDGGHATKKQSGERDEAAASGDGVQRAAQDSGEE